ncbi:hypothetical protein [Agreia sp. COWG]|uniref:hypothetical protein n=1 Tax=Agreia sp. COWG TaxID=2773266 RepID=UPI00192780D1|nr:hypothetical protein [Agreia sp. COWG]CAD6009867.1 protein of unknown function [Agreia sp. COWG]
MVVVESIPGQPWRAGSEGMTVVHYDPLMELMFLRDSYGVSVPSIPPCVYPAAPLTAAPEGERRALASILGDVWASTLDYTRRMPSHALLAYHIFEAGNFGPLANALSADPPPSHPAMLDIEAFSRWRASFPRPSSATPYPQTDGYNDARRTARLRGLSVLVVLPMESTAPITTPEGVVVISDDTYTQPDRLLRVLDEYRPTHVETVPS